MERTPHPEDPAEGAPGMDGADDRTDAERDAVRGGDGRRDADAVRGGDGRPEHIPEHNSAPDGRSGSDADADGGTGGAIQGDASGDGTGGAVQGDANPERRTPLGGDETTAEQLEADNDVEDDSLKTLDPEDPPA